MFLVVSNPIPFLMSYSLARGSYSNYYSLGQTSLGRSVGQSVMPGGVEILLVASCYGNRDKLRPDGPLGSYADYNSSLM